MSRHAASERPPASVALQVAIAAALLVATAIAFAPIRHNAFVNYDDYAYVAGNPNVTAGLTWNGFVWAWTTFQVGNWHPLTMLSHMLDCQLFGVSAAAHHLVSVGWHLLNTLLVFGVLARMTGRPWRSAFVAGLFALHPLHVESVAWVSERKDLLSTFFSLLAIGAYAEYARSGSVLRYALALIAFLAALLSKPMAVTLPCALLLLDAWPLQRWQGIGSGQARERSPAQLPPRSAASLLLEKLPFFLLAALVSAVTLVSQRASGATAASLPFSERAANAVVSYATYLVQMVWPTRLAVLYIFEAPLPPWQIAGSVLLLSGLTAVVLRAGRRYPYLPVGWLWYLGTLVPALGIIHVGSEAMADRFTYVPLLGIFIMVAWGIPDLLAGWRYRRVACAAAGVAILIACAMQTTRQVRLWHDTRTLFEHALAVTRNNYVAHALIGEQDMQEGRRDAAFRHYSEILTIAARFTPVEPYYSDAQYNLGLILAGRGDAQAAADHYRAAVSTNPWHGKAHAGLAAILATQGDTAGAVAHYRAALRVTPDLAAAHGNLAILLEDLGQTDEAIVHYSEAVRLEPQRAEARCNLAAALAGAGRGPEAIEQYRAALALKPQLSEARLGLSKLEGSLE